MKNKRFQILDDFEIQIDYADTIEEAIVIKQIKNAKLIFDTKKNKTVFVVNNSRSMTNEEKRIADLFFSNQFD